MSIEVKIDYEALAKSLAPALIEYIESRSAKEKEPEFWSRADIKKFIGCGETYVSSVIDHPKFPKPAGAGRLRSWKSDEVKKFWENFKK